MNKLHTLAFALLSSATLLACNRPADPPTPPPATAASDAPANTMIGRRVEQAIGKARQELRTRNISVSDGFDFSINGNRINRASALPKADITPQGDLLVEGKTVAISPSQRAQLLEYRGRLIAIADAGMQIGSKGADIAGEALGGVVGAIFGGSDGQKAFEQRMQAKGKQIEAEAMKLCTQMPGLLASQQRLAAALPAFKPYATMTLQDVDDCGRDGKPDPAAVTSE